MEFLSRFFQDDGFQLLNGDFAKILGISLGRQAIRNMVLKRSVEERSKLKGSLSKTFVSLKFDGVTRLRSHFLGISAQFFSEKRGLSVKTLALVDTEANHTSAHLKEILLKTMKEHSTTQPAPSSVNNKLETISLEMYLWCFFFSDQRL